jgi:excisionase family DNA binding protein
MNIPISLEPKKVPLPPEGAKALHINQACAQLNCSRSFLYAQASKGTIRLMKIGGRTLVPVAEVERLLGGEAA